MATEPDFFVKQGDFQFLAAGQTAAQLSVVSTPTLPGDGTTPDVGARNAVAPIVVQCSSVVK